MSGQASFIAPTSVLKPFASTAASTAIASPPSSSSDQPQLAFLNRTSTAASSSEEVNRNGIDRSRSTSSVQCQSTRQPASDSSSTPATSLDTGSSNNKGALAPAASSSASDNSNVGHSSSPLNADRELSSDPQNASGVAWSQWTERLQDHLRAFFSMHHKLFDLVAFYVVMFAINGQMTSLPTRLEWIGFCVQSIVALRRAFQTSIKHGLGLTSFLGMLDLLVGQLFLHQDRFLGLLPTVANILVYFYVINLTRGLVFGDSVSCLLWFLFGLVDIYRKDPSSANLLDLTPYKVIPVHTVGFGLYILMSELVEVMLHSGEPELVQGRYLTYSGGQKNGSGSSRRSNASDPSSSHLRFELCITEITPFTVSFCLNTLSDPLSVQDPDASAASASNPTSPLPSLHSSPAILPSSIQASESLGAGAAKKKSGSDGQVGTKSAQPLNGNSKGSRQRPGQPTPTPGTSRIVSTADIAVHVNYIPWREVLYHYPDQQSFMIYGLTPSTDYEIEMKVYPYSSFVARVGTKAAPPGMSSPFKPLETSEAVETPFKATKGRKNKKNKKDHEKNVDAAPITNSNIPSTNGTLSSNLHDPYPNIPLSPSGARAIRASSPSAPSGLSGSSKSASSLCASGHAPENLQRTKEGQEVALASPLSPSATPAATSAASPSLPKDPREEEMERLRASIQASVTAIQASKASLKKQKRDQAKSEALLRQEMEGLERGQAKAAIQDLKRRQKLSFLQESIKQTQAAASLLSQELRDLVGSQQLGTGRYHGAQMDSVEQGMVKMNEAIKAIEHQEKQEIQQWNKENRQLQQEIKTQDAEQQQWRTKAEKFQEAELAPFQVRLQRLEQQQVVWEVAAEASRDKQKQQKHGQKGHHGGARGLHDHALATLEKEVEQLRESTRQIEASILTLKTQNMELRMRVSQEVEVWESLEERRDSGRQMAHRYHHSRSRSSSRSGSSSSRASGVNGFSPTLSGSYVSSVAGGVVGTSASGSGGSVVASRFGAGADLWSSSPFGFVTTLSPTVASPQLKSISSNSSSSSKQPQQ
ncbi:hypothetical protein DFQ27_008463 [Actinomortierella ambigua]|uniref:Uncharacterized protein n=1 Tax=Actinomortierella ambigua TaxID=1343610 RepID=A0A9P6QJP8_9FUNG|nr:hypothetical protein DFQ27_008463 [Actinomortierella ambigua]